MLHLLKFITKLKNNIYKFIPIILYKKINVFFLNKNNLKIKYK